MMSNPIYEYQLTILEQHLDTFGHVNNAVYLTLYEQARWDFLTKNGLGLTQIPPVSGAIAVLNNR